MSRRNQGTRDRFLHVYLVRGNASRLTSTCLTEKEIYDVAVECSSNWRAIYGLGSEHEV